MGITSEQETFCTTKILAEVNKDEKKRIQISRLTKRSDGKDMGIFFTEVTQSKSGEYYNRKLTGMNKEQLKRFIDTLVKVYKTL